jgi:hypothetical protein
MRIQLLQPQLLQTPEELPADGLGVTHASSGPSADESHEVVNMEFADGSFLRAVCRYVIVDVY